MTLTHLAEALLRSAHSAVPRLRSRPPPGWSPAATGVTDRAMQLAASEGGQVAERRHLAAALAEVVSIRDMLAGTGPFIDHLPTRAPDGGITYHLEATTSGSLSVRERERDEPG